jgi:hypothetical protein
MQIMSSSSASSGARRAKAEGRKEFAMERSDIDLVHDAMREPAQVARHLKALADGLETGVLRLRSGEG